MSQKPEHNCQKMWSVNNHALSFVCYWSHVHDFTYDVISWSVNQTPWIR